MDAPHRLGFEIVSKNDENTRLLGVFAFRTGQELLYAPVFFLNGDIKGTDLIYRHKVKRFLPLNEKIIRRLISMTKLNDGTSVERSYGRRQPQALQLERVAFPPPTYKKASDGKDVFDAPAFEAELSRQVEIPSAGLADFVQNKGGAHALEKLASLMERVPAFAAACDERLTKSMLGVASDSPFPADVAVETVLRGISKSAFAAEKSAARDAAYRALIGADGANVKIAAAFFGEEQLILRTSDAAVFNKEASAERRQKAAQRGYDLEDTRRDLKPAIAYYSEELRTLQRPGVHRVMDAEGNTVRVRAFHSAARSIYELTRRCDGDRVTK